MKRNIVNDKVIRAMAIGISAMLATTTPMTALAADGVDDPEGDNPNEAGQTTNPSSDVCDAAQAVALDALKEDGVIDKAQGSAGTVKDDVVASVAAGEAGKDDKDNDLAQKVIDAAKKTEDTTVEGGSSIAEAESYITNAKDQLDVAETNDGLSDSALGKATDIATNAETIAKDLNKAMDEANAKVDEQPDDIQNATTIADANAAYAELETTASEAQQAFNAKLAEYNKAKDDYDEAAAKVKEYEEAYNKAIANAGTNAADAQAELEKAKANAAALEQAVADAKAAVATSAAGALEIADKEKLTSEDSGLVWTNEDELFKVIMKNYYLPKVLKIYDENANVTRIQGKDNNNYNYFKVDYTDSEGSKTVYYNYKMDKDKNGKESEDKIVIFEKRIEEVDWEKYQNENPDQYVKDNDPKTVVDVEAGLEDGTVVNAGGKYFEKNAMTDSETLVSNSEITKTSTTDVTVDDNTKKDSWQYDAKTGELVKTVTADVTTITYTDAEFTSDKFYATDAERDAAAADKKAELETATGKDATIKETEKTTYTATGTYIPTFTETVNVKKEVEWDHTGKWNDAGVRTEAEAVAQVKKDEEKDLQRKIKRDDDLYFLGVSSNLAVTGHTEDKRYDDSDFIVSGTVSATYAKVTKKTVDQSTFGALWDDIKSMFGGQSTNEKLEEKARKAVEAEGGIFISANWADWSFNKATIRYVAGVKVTTDEKQDEQTAKDAVNAAIAAQAKANKTGVYNVNIADPVAHTTYSYTVNYLKGDKTTENKAVATETYGNASGLSGQIIQNKNYLDKKILLTQKDKAYRTFVDDAKKLTGKYESLLTEAQKANADVLAAREKVQDLQDKIDELLKNKSTNTKKLEELAAKLVIAQADRDEAETTLNVILEKLDNAGVTRDEVINRLTPNTPGAGNGGNGGNPGGNGGNGENGDNVGNDDIGGAAPGTTYGGLGTDTTTAGPATVVTTTTTAATTANTAVAAQTVAANGAGVGNVAAGNAGAGNAAGNAAAGNQGVVTIEDEATPLAASIDDQDTTDTEQNKEDAQSVTIEDEASPLDASIDQEKMSWWWLLIVLVLGATGYEMYRKHQEKKKAAEEIKVEE